MKKTITLSLIATFFYISSFAQQPTTWPIEGDAAAPSSSWQAYGYDASSSVVNGIWKLYQPKQLATEATRNVYIQYNPGRLTDVTTTYSNITTDLVDLKYLIINLKNHTDKTAIRFYYRYNNGGTESWKPYDFPITANDANFKDYVIDLSLLANWDDYAKMPLIRFDFVAQLPVYVAPATPDLVLEVDYIGFSSTTTLPVTLSSFTANKNNNGIVLNWTTASEHNNAHFDIMRSSDGKVFEKIATVAGAGNSSKMLNYDFRDLNPVAGTNYYQLKQVDFNGASTLSGIEAVNFAINVEDFKVAVGESRDLTFFVLSNTTTKVKVTINNLNGMQVAEYPYLLSAGQNAFKVGSNSLPSGLYVATLIKDGTAFQSKFVMP